jgi:hypothetical protein
MSRVAVFPEAAPSSAENLEAEASLAVLVAHARTQGLEGGDRELLARAITRLVLRLRVVEQPAREALPEDPQSAPVQPPYDDLVVHLRDAVARSVPGGRRVAVVSRGDADLLQIRDRATSHFPAGRDGSYAGFYPVDGQAALVQLTEAIEAGVEYLAIPETGRWWLDFYSEFGSFLRTECRILVDDPAVGAVFELAPSTQENN